MSNYIAYFVVILLGGLSFALWWEIIRRKMAGVPVLPFRGRDPVHWSPTLIRVTGCWLFFQIYIKLYPLIRPLFAEVEKVDPNLETTHLEGVQLLLLMNIVVFLILVLLLSEFGRRRFSEFGITLKNWRRETSFGIQGFVASLIPVLIMRLATLPFHTPETQHPLLKMLQESPDPVTIGWVALAAIVMAPLAEELVFRVILQGYLQSRLSPIVSIWTSALVFSGIHGFPDALALIPLALILGYVYHRRHSYLAVVVVHALFNLLNLLMLLLGPSLEQPEPISWIFR